MPRRNRNTPSVRRPAVRAQGRGSSRAVPRQATRQIARGSLPTARPVHRTGGSGTASPLGWRAPAAALVAVGLVLVGLQLKDYVWPGQPASACVVAVDPQGSTRAMAATYESWVPDQVRACADKNSVVSLVLVTSETRTGTTMPAVLDLTKIDYTGNDVRDRELVNNAVDKFVGTEVPALFQAPKQLNLGTDLIGLDCVAADLLKGRVNPRLVIDTDGMNDREPYKLRRIALDPDSVQKYIQALKGSGQICDLDGVQVAMFGTGIGTGTAKLDAGKLGGVETFWRAFFEASGATVVAYGRSA